VYDVTERLTLRFSDGCECEIEQDASRPLVSRVDGLSADGENTIFFPGMMVEEWDEAEHAFKNARWLRGGYKRRSHDTAVIKTLAVVKVRVSLMPKPGSSEEDEDDADRDFEDYLPSELVCVERYPGLGFISTDFCVYNKDRAARVLARIGARDPVEGGAAYLMARARDIDEEVAPRADCPDRDPFLFTPGPSARLANVLSLVTTVDVMWQDGSVTTLPSGELATLSVTPPNAFWPGQYVVEKEAEAPIPEEHQRALPQIARDTIYGSSGQRYGMVYKALHGDRIARVFWLNECPAFLAMPESGLSPSHGLPALPEAPSQASTFDLEPATLEFCVYDVVTRAPSPEESAISDMGLISGFHKGLVKVTWFSGRETYELPGSLALLNLAEREEYADDGAESSGWEDEIDGADAQAEAEAEAGNVAAVVGAPSAPAPAPLQGTQDERLLFRELAGSGNPAAESVLASAVSENRWWAGPEDGGAVVAGMGMGMGMGTGMGAGSMESALRAIEARRQELAALAAANPAAAEVPAPAAPAAPAPAPAAEPVGRFVVLASAPADHRGLEEPLAPLSSKTIKAVQKEWGLLSSGLPEGIVVHVYEEHLGLLRAMLVGPSHTPYHDCLFFFDIIIPDTYPALPPKVHFRSQLSEPMNPNLYVDGTVCLSILGTWKGADQRENWDPSSSTILQVLVSIWGLVLVSEPWYNEPGFEKHKGSMEGITNSISYNEGCFVQCLRCMLLTLEKPCTGFEEVVREHFVRRAPAILARCEKVIAGTKLYVPESKLDELYGLFGTSSSLLPNYEHPPGFIATVEKMLQRLRKTMG
jgi:ubiquitin-protein ligase